MKSYFLELEQELYNSINNSPISIDAKYIIVRDIFNNIRSALEDYLQMPEQTIENNTNETYQETKIEKEYRDDGTVNIKASGSDISEVVEKAILETKSKEEE